MSYYREQILEILKDGNEHKLDESDLMRNIHMCKLTYVIKQLKKCINEGLILKRNNPESNLLWKNHYYFLK